MIPRLWVSLACAVAICGSIVSAYLKGRGDGRAVEIASRAKADQIRMETLQLAQHAAAEEIAKIQVVNKTIYQKAVHEVVQTPVYRDCGHTPDGLRSVNQALSNSADSPGEGELSGADAAR